MIRNISAGSYVVAVSGGVDSIVLLNMLSNQRELSLTVAHFDHGMRVESAEDRLFVQALAVDYDLPFIYEEGHLGSRVSEATARQARYDFLRRVQKQRQAKAIVTAHHQDDLLETAIINLLRGTGRKGLTSLADSADIKRPLLEVPKAELKEYAQVKKLQWREDSTNAETKYLRNYVRHEILPRFSPASKQKLVRIINESRAINHELDGLLASQLQLHAANDRIDRLWFSQLPHDIAKEFLAAWLRQHELRDFDRKTLERLVVGAKTAAGDRQFDIMRAVTLEVGRSHLALKGLER